MANSLFSIVGLPDTSAELKKGPGNLTQLLSPEFLSQDSNQFLAVELLRRRAQTDPEVQAFLAANRLRSLSAVYKDHPGFYHFVVNNALASRENFTRRHSSCDQLKTMAEKELNRLSEMPDCAPFPATPAFPDARLEAALKAHLLHQGKEPTPTIHP